MNWGDRAVPFDCYVFSSRGGREYNEDSADVFLAEDRAAFVLADGLGGHLCGDIASKSAVETILGQLREVGKEELGEAAFRQIFTAANERVLELQREKAARMKSTAVALYIASGMAHWAHIGDSRLYRIRDGALADITEDHSVAFKKYKAGEITRAQIGRDEDQSSLLRALGNPGEIAPDYGSAVCEPTDAFLLCSDGVWEHLLDEEVRIDRLKSATAREWAELMLLRVTRRVERDHDNLSMIAVILK